MHTQSILLTLLPLALAAPAADLFHLPTLPIRTTQPASSQLYTTFPTPTGPSTSQGYIKPQPTEPSTSQGWGKPASSSQSTVQAYLPAPTPTGVSSQPKNCEDKTVTLQQFQCSSESGSCQISFQRELSVGDVTVSIALDG